MVDVESDFLDQGKSGEITFLCVQQKQGQNGFVRLRVPGYTAKQDVILGVTQFVF